MSQIAKLHIAIAGLSCLAIGQTPTITADGVLHGASLRSGIAPGAVVSIFGRDLASSPTSANTLPLPTTLGGVSVTFDGMQAGMLYVSAGQINVQAPWSVLELGQETRMVPVVVSRDGRSSSTIMVGVNRVSPGVFTINGSGTGMAVALNASDGTFAQAAGGQMGTMARAARIGSVVTIYGTGLGNVSPAVATGSTAANLVRRVLNTPEVMIGGRSAQVLYAGMSPSYPGVTQINVVVPAGVSAGSAVPVQIRLGSAASAERVTIAVDAAVEAAEQLPGADATAIWNYVQRQNFRENYPLIPGKGQLYQGIAPHNQLLTVQVNSIAKEALDKKSGSMPPGSIILKEAHSAGGELANSLLMYKIAGFDPANGDWYWSTRRPNGTIGGSGSVAGCFSCHSRSAANDYLFLGTPLASPPADAGAIRSFIARQNYRETWRLWPGTTAMQASQSVHGAAVSIYVNELAFDAIRNGVDKMPAGAFVLKESFRADRTLTDRTVMYKSPGFDAANNDWYWYEERADGSPVVSGKVQGCIGCHSASASNDYLQVAPIGARPQPRAADVSTYLTRQDYQRKWRLWPGTTAFSTSAAPHGATVTTYVNDVAYEAIAGKRGTLPEGSIVVKENFMPDRTLAAVTLMYKYPGFDPDHGDWFWMQRLANGNVPAQGRVAGCINCHSQNADNDYLNVAPIK